MKMQLPMIMKPLGAALFSVWASAAERANTEARKPNPNLEASMKTTQTLLAAVILGTCLFTATQANATLISVLGGQVVNDTDMNITWLANANVNGAMTWNGAQSWITSLNTANYLGYNDWRLPTTLQPDASCSYQSGSVSYGYNCTGSEMGHLFYSELGGVAGSSIATTHNTNYGLFQNVQSDTYWSGTEYAPNTTGSAWLFHTLNGSQGTYSKGTTLFALAVRPGQVAAVPIPATAWLLGSGLMGLLGIARRKCGNESHAG